MDVIIVDDEPAGRRTLRELCRAEGDLEVVGEYGDGNSALEAVRSLRPQLLFLDIQMDPLNGIDVARALDPIEPPSLVFVTAYDQHALRAFEVGALDYLLKPFDDQRFMQVLGRAKVRHRQTAETRHFIVKSGNTIDIVKLADIDWIEACDYYSSLHAGGKTHMLRRSLTELETQLKPHAFARIHRSAIVNVERIRALEIRQDGEYDVVLESGQRLRLSRRYRKDMLERLTP